MLMEEEAKFVPKNGSASSAAANGKYDLCGRTPTSEVTLTIDEISAASLIKHDAGITDRSKSILIGLRNYFHVRVGLASFIVLVGGALVPVLSKGKIRPQFRDLYLGIRRPNIDNVRWFSLNNLLLIVLVAFNLFISLAAEHMPFFEWIMDAMVLIQLSIPVIQLLYLLRPLFRCVFPRKDLNRDGEITQTEDISPIEEGLFSDEAVYTEFVVQMHDSAADSISDTTDFSPWERGASSGTGGYGIVCVARNRDDEITQTEDISPIEEGLFRDESVNTEFVNQVYDSAADSISDAADFSPWERGGCIGTGGFGIVYVDRNRKTGDLRAVKELKNIENAESLRKEIKILCQLEHPNIVKYYGHEIDGHKVSVYMEFIQPGSLKKYILERGALHETLIRNFTAQILSGLAYLHSKRVVHRDLKPDNILVDPQDIVKLVDFSVSKHLTESMGNHSMWGTPYYAAPEVLQQIEYKSSLEGYAADIWSLGCAIIEMLSGKHPWPDCNWVQVVWKVSVKNQRPPIPDELCQEGKHFLELCFRKTPADRPSAAELQDHPFVKTQTCLADGKEYEAELDGVVEIIGVLA